MASTFITRTPSVAGNRKTFTISYWVKRGKLGTQQGVCGVYENVFVTRSCTVLHTKTSV